MASVTDREEHERMKGKIRVTVVGMEKVLWNGLVKVARDIDELDRALEKKRGREELLEGGGRVVAESVAEVKEAEVAELVVRLPVVVAGEGSKKRRVEVVSDKEEEVMRKAEEVLIAQLGPRAVCGGLLRRVGKESVFTGADRRLAAGGSSTPAALGVSRRPDA